jgi:hypothetical protein
MSPSESQGKNLTKRTGPLTLRQGAVLGLHSLEKEPPMAKTVWILGAGFSEPLGGPLLTDMLTNGSYDRIQATFPEKGSPGREDAYPRLYRPQTKMVILLNAEYGQDAAAISYYSGQRKQLSKKQWGDAEEFLELFDSAARQEKGNSAPGAIPAVAGPAQLCRLLLRGIDVGESVTPSDVACAARRLLAAECSWFLKYASPTYEKWQPYRRWVSMLDPSRDTIITFNYDTVVETVAGPVTAVLPPTTPEEQHKLERDPLPYVRLLKLHGSTNWLVGNFDKGARVQASSDRFAALTADDDQILIASPGPTKQEVTAEHLERLWQMAERAIREADAIVFVGYRFPPTDSTAREQLMRAIERNDNDRKRLHVHTVLGADVGSPNSRRLRGMLESVLEARADELNRPLTQHHITQHPMGAEDFLALYDRDRLPVWRDMP